MPNVQPFIAPRTPIGGRVDTTNPSGGYPGSIPPTAQTVDPGGRGPRGEFIEQPWTVCQSSNVAAFRRAGDRGQDLEVMFRSRAVYQYFGAGMEYDHMYRAASKGRFVWQSLRNVYSYSMTTAGVAHGSRHRL